MSMVTLPDGERVFVPYPQCTAAGGDCSIEGRCLGRCRSVSEKALEKRLAALERRVLSLEIDRAKKT